MTPTARRHLQIAKSYLEREGLGDLQVVDDLMTEGIVMTIVSGNSPHTAHAIPWSGVHRGREAAKLFIRRLLAGQVTQMDKIDRWVADDDTAVAFGVQQVNSPTTGRSGEWEVAIRFDFEGDLISHFWVYEDSFSAVVVHSTGGEITMSDAEGTRVAPLAAHIVPNA